MKAWKVLVSLLLALVALSYITVAATIGTPAIDDVKQYGRINNSIPVYCIGKNIAKYFTRVVELVQKSLQDKLPMVNQLEKKQYTVTSFTQ